MMQNDVNLLPIRGNTVHEILENDHEVIRALLNSLQQSTTSADRQQILEQLKGVLTIHNATEENLVYPALDKVAGHKIEALKLYNETAAADILLFQIDTLLKEGDQTKSAEKIEKLHDAVFKHIDAEEKSALPHLEKGAETQEAQMLLQSVREFRSAMRFTPAGIPASRAYTGEVGGRVQTPSSTTRRT